MKKIELQSKIGKRISEVRKKKEISLSQLAKLCDKDRQSIYKVEKGEVNPTLFTLYEISNALNISISELLKDLEV